jgi:hypothetical protein
VLIWYHNPMKRVIKYGTKNKVGRPATGIGMQVGARWSSETIAEIDNWRRTQDDLPSRSEAIRRLVEKGLKAKS